MSCCPIYIKKGEFFELLARIVGWTGSPIIQSDVTSISYDAFILREATGEETPVDSFQDVSLTVADCLENALIINPTKWDEDTIGYNFHFVPDASIFSQRGDLYGIRVTFVLADVDLDPLMAVYLLEVR
jgi:hypothetical protein